MSDSDSDSSLSGRESWMDASIRLHLRDMAGSSHQEQQDENDAVDEIISPPISVPAMRTESTTDSSGKEEPNAYYETTGVVIADLVHDVQEETANKEQASVENGRIATAAAAAAAVQNNDYDPTRGRHRSSTSQHTAAASPSASKVKQVRRRQETRYQVSQQLRRNTNTADSRDEKRTTRKKNKATKRSRNAFSKYIVTRTSLPYSIDHNEMTLEWTAMINTNQEAIDKDDVETMEETTVCMTFRSMEEAREACHAYAPPRMHSFEDSPKCNICKKVFNRLLRRPCHCRNCGVCVCSTCTVVWPRCMLPVTYHSSRRRKNYKVCMACDWLSGAFRQALLKGDMDRAVALHATGNVNTRCKFANVRGDHYYPVHCAVLGGNISVFKWLVETLCCPIHVTRRGNSLAVQSNLGLMEDEKIVTSQGKSVLDVAMETQELGILYYLIIELGVNVMHYRNLHVALRAFEAALRHLPEHLKATVSTE